MTNFMANSRTHFLNFMDIHSEPTNKRTNRWTNRHASSQYVLVIKQKISWQLTPEYAWLSASWWQTFIDGFKFTATTNNTAQKDNFTCYIVSKLTSFTALWSTSARPSCILTKGIHYCILCQNYLCQIWWDTVN